MMFSLWFEGVVGWAGPGLIVMQIRLHNHAAIGTLLLAETKQTEQTERE